MKTSIINLIALTLTILIGPIVFAQEEPTPLTYQDVFGGPKEAQLKKIWQDLRITTQRFEPILTGVGNSGGGNAEYCFNDPSTPKLIIEKYDGNIPNNLIVKDTPQDIHFLVSAELLDRVEATKTHGRERIKPVLIDPIKTGSKWEDQWVYVRRVLDRIKNINPLFYSAAIEAVAIFESRPILNMEDSFPPIRDYKPQGNPDLDRCVIATIIKQDSTSGLPQLYVDERVFWNDDLHSRASQYQSLLHEVVYLVFRGVFKQKNANRTRDLVRLLVQKKTTYADLQNFWRSVKTDHFYPNNLAQQIKEESNRPVELLFLQRDLRQVINPKVNEFREAVTEKTKASMQLFEAAVDDGLRRMFPDLECHELAECIDLLVYQGRTSTRRTIFGSTIIEDDQRQKVVQYINHLIAHLQSKLGRIWDENFFKTCQNIKRHQAAIVDPMIPVLRSIFGPAVDRGFIDNQGVCEIERPKYPVKLGKIDVDPEHETDPRAARYMYADRESCQDCVTSVLNGNRNDALWAAEHNFWQNIYIAFKSPLVQDLKNYPALP